MSRILLVDNEVDNTSLFRLVLEDNGFVVDVSNDSTLVLANFKPGYYELIILDIRMPKMDGITLRRKIRKIDDIIKICFLTASEFKLSSSSGIALYSLLFLLLVFVTLLVFSLVLSFIWLYY